MTDEKIIFITIKKVLAKIGKHFFYGFKVA